MALAVRVAARVPAPAHSRDSRLEPAPLSELVQAPVLDREQVSPPGLLLVIAAASLSGSKVQAPAAA
jgi:hypothetical protein